MADDSGPKDRARGRGRGGRGRGTFGLKHCSSSSFGIV